MAVGNSFVWGEIVGHLMGSLGAGPSQLRKVAWEGRPMAEDTFDVECIVDSLRDWFELASRQPPCRKCGRAI